VSNTSAVYLSAVADAAQSATPDTQLFRDVFNASPIGIAVENLEGQPLFVNPAFCSFLGLSEEELRNKHCVDFSPPEDAQKDWALFQQLRAGSIDHYQLEKRYFRRDGSLVWGSLSISLLKSSPSPLVLALVEDITDKKKAEEARFRHAAAIESSDDAIASGTLDGIIVSWNTGAQKIYGYTEAEAVGKPTSMLFPPELPDEENKILEALKSGDRIENFETVRVTKTGKRINVSLTISPIKDSTGRTVGISGIARDITERKLAEEALRASEERLRLAQQAARIGTFDWNIQTGVNAWTPELEAMYGLPPGGFGGTQTAFENLVHPDDRAGVIELNNWALKTGNPTKGEWRVVWADGSVHWIAGRWQVFMDASGEPSKMIGVNIDVSESKLADEARLEVNRSLEAQAALLQSREELLKIFVKHVPAAVAMLDRDMRYLQVSDRWCTDYLRGRAQVLGCSHYEIFPDMPERWKEVHRRGLQGETLRHDEDRWDGQDGPHWARWEVRPWKTPEDTVGGILILAEDITRRKQMEEALCESEDKLRLLLDSTAEAIYGIDLEHRCTFCNPACLRTLGYERMDEVLGKNTHDLLHHSRADGTVFPVEECRVHRVTQTGEGFHAEDEVFWRANGTSFPAEYWSYPQRRGQELVGAVVAFVDITERKLAEAALANVSRKLIEAQEQERIRIGRELHDDIGQRLALVAVELQQLHENSIILPDVRSRMGELQKQISEIATDIQSLSHELHSAKLQYLGIAAAMRGFCREFAEQQKVEIDFKAHDLPSPLSPDISLCLFRVLQEALHNSAKHSGVRQFEVRLWGTSDEIDFTVKDSGAGFDREAAKQSRGLGLISMEERLKLVMGTLSIESELKCGTTIHARVPLSSGLSAS
jgi:PAS domain S-box-containing protein